MNSRRGLHSTTWCSYQRMCSVVLLLPQRAAPFVVLRHGEDVIPDRSCATSPFRRWIQFVSTALTSREGRRPALVTVGQSGGATGETEMKLLRVFATLACLFFNAAKLDSSCNCDGKLCHMARTGRDLCAFNTGSYWVREKGWYLCIWVGTTSCFILATGNRKNPWHFPGWLSSFLGL